MDSTLASTLLVLVGGFLGVLLGGLLDIRRTRWQWKMDAREKAYLGFLRAIEELTQFANECWLAMVTADVSEAEVNAAVRRVDRQADELELAVRQVRIVGSPPMVKRGDDATSLARNVRIVVFIEEHFPDSWNPGELPGMEQDAVALAEGVEYLARKELSPVGLRERWAARSARKQPQN